MLPDGYRLRRPTPRDASALAEAARRNREHLTPWEPGRAPAHFTASGQAAALRLQLEAAQRGLLDPWLVVTDDDEVVGRANIQNVVRGAMQGGTLGYWVDVGHLRRGVARGAVEELVAHGLTIGLHRLEAATMVANTASQRVLEATGFATCGLAPDFLHLDGAWRDHLLWQRVLHDGPPRGAPRPAPAPTPRPGG